MGAAGALDDFTAEVRRADGPRLDHAALLIARGEYPDLDVAAALRQIDELAAPIAARLPLGAPPVERAAAVRGHLFEELGFHGAHDDYYDPRNSYLNDVLDRRTGLPIALSLLFIEVARRVGLEAKGVGYPRHFLVKYEDGGEERLVDPFHGGEEFTASEVRQGVRQRAGAGDEALDYYLAAVTPRQLLTRVLTNLKLVYTSHSDDARALRTQEFLLALSPWSLPDVRDRGLFRARTGDTAGSLADLEAYLAHEGDAADAGQVRELVARLRNE